MASSTHPQAMQNHPARGRHHVNGWWVAFGIVGAPAAWVLHLMMNFSVSSEVCSPGSIYGHAHDISSLHTGMLIDSVAALCVAAVAGWISYNSWRATHAEEQGDHEHLLEIGEGRTRFLSMVGIVLSGGFFTAIVFDSLALLMVPFCG